VELLFHTVTIACSSVKPRLFLQDPEIMRGKRQATALAPLIGQIFEKLAPKIGAKILFEPKWRTVGQISFRNGRKRYFRHNTIDLNTLGASDVAKDKGFANFFMEQMGYPVVPGRTFFSSDWCAAIGSRDDINAAYRYARSIGFPVVVKPNSGSQGKGVAKIFTRADFYKAMRAIFREDRVGLVQTALSGRDYRIVVLDDRIISAYERVPLNVTGDGRKSISGLLREKQRKFVASTRDTRLKPQDVRIADKLKRDDLTLNSVLPRGRQVFLLDNANLSSGGDAVEVTHSIHPEFKKIAIRLTRDMGLRLCGVDLMVAGDLTEAPNKYWVLEINAAPGLDHYARAGRVQRKIVESLYLDVLASLAS
jgi:D-alanine-D-alanine ligase-like ATP-grasp enzyme